MKTFGFFLIIGSILLGIYSFNMDTTVALDNSLSNDYTYSLPERVHNIGLMQERQNLFILSGVLFIAGVILISLGKDKQMDNIKCPNCAEYVKTEAIICKHCGSSLNHDSGFDIEKYRK